MTTFDVAACLLLLAATVGVVNNRFLGLPRAIALLLGALLAALLLLGADAVFVQRGMIVYWRARLQGAHLPNIMLDGVLPLLLFAGSMQVELQALRNRAWTILALTTASVALATFLFGVGFRAISVLSDAPVPYGWCFVLGALLAPTDAVVVEGLLRPVRMPGSVRIIIAGESLFNDGAAIVLFLAALAITRGEPAAIGHGQLLLQMATIGGGSVALGWAGGLLAAAMSQRVSDRTVEVTISLALALGVYRLAVVAGLSGPIAVVAAGLAFRYPVRWIGHSPASAQVIHAWEVIEDVINTFLFLLIGFELLIQRTTLTGLALVLLSFLLALLVRGLSVCVPIAMLRMSLGERWRALVTLTWTGLRGGISVALALTLPDTPYRNTIVLVCYSVVVLTIVVQGLLISPVLRRLYGTAGAAQPSGPG